MNPRPPRPRLKPAVLLYLALDLVGMVLFASGVLWFAQGRTLFISGYPTSAFEAGVALVGGLLLMIWSAARILRVLFLSRPGGKDGRPGR
jgi:hypothetical protein